MLIKIKHIWKRIDRKITISKREQFGLVTLLLTSGLLLTQLVPYEFRYVMVFILSLCTYGGYAFALREDLAGIEYFTLLTLPTLFTAAVSLSYFLLPVRWLTRLPIAALYGIGIYALLLTENIYNVAANRGIALLRAAQSVGFLITLATEFFLLLTLLSLHLPVFFQTLFLFIISCVLCLQDLWAGDLSDQLKPKTVELAAVVALVSAELGFVFYFWPVKTVLVALVLVSSNYSFLGMAKQYLSDMLYRKTVMEFSIVFTLVLGIVFLTTHWRGPV